MENHSLGLATQVLVMAIVISVILLFLGIGVLVLIHACIVGRMMRNGASERNINMEERGCLGSSSMSHDDIDKLPCFDFAAKAKGSSPAGDCAVCLEKFEVGERCRLLPSCHHSFHADCVDLWLLRTPLCPICRAVACDFDCSGEEMDRGGEREEGGGSDERESRSGDDLVPIERADAPVLDSDSAQSQMREGMDSSSERVIEMRERC